MQMYRGEQYHLDKQCKVILNSIQNLQNKYRNVRRLKEVTDNLERLSKVVNFDWNAKTEKYKSNQSSRHRFEFWSKEPFLSRTANLKCILD